MNRPYGTGKGGNSTLARRRAAAAHSHTSDTTVKKMIKTALIMATSFAPTSKKTLGSARSGAGSLFFLKQHTAGAKGRHNLTPTMLHNREELS
jgi:hypothetical protein